MFERIGGTPALTEIIDRLYVKILGSELTSPLFNGKDLAHIKAMQVEFFSNALGSGTPYTGRDMLSVHTNLFITEEQFVQVGAWFNEVLKDFNVEQNIVEAIKTLAGSVKSDIVGH